MATSPDPFAARTLPEGADPVAANADSVTPVPPPVGTAPTTRAVLTAGVVTGLTAGLLCTVLRIVAALFRTDFVVVWPGGGVSHLPWVVTLLVPILAGIVGSGVAAIFLGVRANRQWVFWLGTSVMAASAAYVLLQPEPVTWPTRIWLCLMIVVTWLLVVPQVARVVGDSDPRVTAAYRETGLTTG